MIYCGFCKEEYNTLEEAEKCTDNCMKLRDIIVYEVDSALDELFKVKTPENTVEASVRGNYMNKCVICHGMMVDADKRCIVCLRCDTVPPEYES